MTRKTVAAEDFAELVDILRSSMVSWNGDELAAFDDLHAKYTQDEDEEK